MFSQTNLFEFMYLVGNALIYYVSRKIEGSSKINFNQGQEFKAQI